MRPSTLVLCVVSLFCGCGSKGEDSAVRGPSFDSMTHEERAAYMASDVLPTMAGVFQAFDSERYADFSCATCHVTGLSDGSYAMPDAGLPPLREADFPYTSEVGVFMEDEVLATMRDLLGPTDGGRPCTTCHTLTE